MCIDSLNERSDPNQNCEYVKEVRVNGMPIRAFIDFGSEATLLKEKVALDLGLIHNGVPSLI